MDGKMPGKFLNNKESPAAKYARRNPFPYEAKKENQEKDSGMKQMLDMAFDEGYGAFEHSRKPWRSEQFMNPYDKVHEKRMHEAWNDGYMAASNEYTNDAPMELDEG